MEFVVVATIALLASALTFFSGFGLGTLLMPAFAFFFPVEVAIAATAVVHGLNNLLKIALVGRHASKDVVLRFGLPAIGAAILGALLLRVLGEAPSLARYEVWGRECNVSPVDLSVGAVMVGFAVLELSPRFDALAFPRRWLGVGGIVSGFFGGLSGHQGALRSAFLVRCDLTKEQLLGTNAVLGAMVDGVRLAVYALAGVVALHHDGPDAGVWTTLGEGHGAWLVGVGTLAALVGTLAGQRLIRKVTLRGVRWTVGVLLLVLGVALGAGVL